MNLKSTDGLIMQQQKEISMIKSHFSIGMKLYIEVGLDDVIMGTKD